MIHPLEEADIQKVLAENLHAHLGCCDGDTPYVVPMSYVYRDGAILSYTHAGKKIAILRKNPKVCVHVGDMTNGQWRSVVVTGTFEELKDSERTKGIQLIGERINASGASLPFLPDNLVPKTDELKPIIYRVNIKETTGRSFG